MLKSTHSKKYTAAHSLTGLLAWMMKLASIDLSKTDWYQSVSASTLQEGAVHKDVLEVIQLLYAI